MTRRLCPCSACSVLEHPWQLPRTIKRHLEKQEQEDAALAKQRSLKPDSPLQLPSHAPSSSAQSDHSHPLLTPKLNSPSPQSSSDSPGRGLSSRNDVEGTQDDWEEHWGAPDGNMWDNGSIMQDKDSDSGSQTGPFALDDFTPVSAASSRSVSPLALAQSSSRHGSQDSDSDTSPPSSNHGESSDEELDITHDPAFIPRAQLFPFREEGDELEYDPSPPPAAVPPALLEDSISRNAYVRAWILSLRGATHTQVQGILEGSRSMIASFMAKDPTLANIDLEGFAITLPTIERRLGVDTSAYVKYYIICDVCWFRHEPNDLYKLKSPHCTQDTCPGRLYTTKRTLSTGNKHTEKRTPCKILPYAMLIRAIQRILLRPGKWDDFQHWRGPGDEPGQVRPADLDEWLQGRDVKLPMTDVHDGWAWRAVQAGLERRKGGVWGMEDVIARGVAQRFVSLPCGLLLAFNIDWFQTIKGSIHSTGAMYVTIINNPRAIRFLREETILVCVLPGPHEPSLEQLNHVLEPMVREINTLYGGIDMDIHGFQEQQPIHATLFMNNSDLPASRKTAGLSSHSSELHMCPYCNVRLSSLVSHKCYDFSSFHLREGWRYIKYSFKSRFAPQQVRDRIAEERGKRWSVVDALPGWIPSTCSPPDYMHMVYLCLVRHLLKSILLDGGMFNARTGDKEGPRTRFEEILEAAWWPGSVSRPPKKILGGGGSIKADQLRNVLTLLPVALFHAWNEDGMVPDTDTPPAKPTTKIAEAEARTDKLMAKRWKTYLKTLPQRVAAKIKASHDFTRSRNLKDHYENILLFCAALRILGSRSVSVSDVQRATRMLSTACQNWALMNLHMTPYFHLAMHALDPFLRYGPSYGWHVWAYERHNGRLGKYNHNGHAGGELEATLMRSWWKAQLITDLIQHLRDLPEQTAEDQDSIRLLETELKGNEAMTRNRGTLDVMLASLQAESSGERTRLPKQSKPANLHQLDIYYDILEQVRLHWREHVNLASDREQTAAPEADIFFGNTARSYAYIEIDSIRYGAGTSTRGAKFCYAYIDHRRPVYIEYIFSVTHRPLSGSPVLLEALCATIRPFILPAVPPEIPWDMWAADLGAGLWIADKLGEREVIDTQRWSGQLVLCPLPICNDMFWVTLPHDHFGQEIDIPLDGLHEDQDITE